MYVEHTEIMMAGRTLLKVVRMAAGKIEEQTVHIAQISRHHRYRQPDISNTVRKTLYQKADM